MHTQLQRSKGFGNQLKALGESIIPLAIWVVAFLLMLAWVWVLLKGLGWVDATLERWLS